MITKERMKEALDLAVFRGATYISEDVYKALQAAIDREDGPAKEGLHRTLQSLELSREKGLPACPDTGWPLFFIKLGNEAQLEGGVLALQELGRQAIREATLKGTLRKTMKHPITGFDPGDNVSEHTPYFTIQYVPGNEIEITYAAKGGGSEVFGGTRHQMLAFADGLDGIRQSGCCVSSRYLRHRHRWHRQHGSGSCQRSCLPAQNRLPPSRACLCPAGRRSA